MTKSSWAIDSCSYPHAFRCWRVVLVLALFLLTGNTEAVACANEGPTHNAYLFSVFNRDLMTDRFVDRTDAFWKQYLGLKPTDSFSYRWNAQDVMDAAKKRGDKETMVYLNWLNIYLKDNELFTGWNYPTRQQLQQRQRHLHLMVQSGRNYKGKRYRSQYALLQMRGLFGLKQYQQVIALWQSKGRKLSSSVYRDIMENLYAGALLRTGRKHKAVEIYARQQDFTSLKYCVRKYRNLAGIKATYRQNPNSATLTYLVQDFVNSTQETMDALQEQYASHTASAADSDLVRGMKLIDASVVYRQDALDFVDFARNVLREGKTQQPCLWQSAIGTIHFLLGDYAVAKTELAEAQKLGGTQRMKDNARAIYAVNSVFTEHYATPYYNWLAGEMKWMNQKSDEENKDGQSGLNHYDEVKDRLVMRHLVPMLRRNGQNDLALALVGMQCVGDGWGTVEGLNYYDAYFDDLQSLTPEQLIAYCATINDKPKNQLEALAYSSVNGRSNYYNDLIGTKLLANGRFSEALPYLEKVSLKFLSRQNIAPYAAHRDYNRDRWMGRQKITDSEMNDSVSLKENKKALFCREMIKQEVLLHNMREGMEKRLQAYKVASLYYQASYEGDCWWLTQYGVSSSQDSALSGTKDFVAQAIELLQPLTVPCVAGLDSKEMTKQVRKAARRMLKASGSNMTPYQLQQSDFKLQQHSLYALAFIHRDPWYREGWDEATNQWYDYHNLSVRPASRQYKALSALRDFASAHASQMDSYVSKCDVLKRFQEARR
jgi:hypothetical protein